MSKKLDLTGQRFGRLTVISLLSERRRDNQGRSQVIWVCRCSCGEEKEFTSTSLRRDNATRCGVACPDALRERQDKRNEYQRRWAAQNTDKTKGYQKKCRLKHPETSRRATADYRARRREQLNHEKIGKPCVDCGGIFPPECMDFDHLGGKKFQIGQSHSSFPWKVVLEEIAKCELVCANCHRIRTKRRHLKCPENNFTSLKIISPCCV